MRRLLVFIFSASLYAVPPTVSGLHVDTPSISHSDFRFFFDVSGSYDAIQTRYAVSPATCTGGSGGSLQVTGTNQARYTSNMAMVLAGLAANTTYNVCPEVSNDGGVSFSSGVSLAVTTQALPAVHPAVPIAPATFSTAPPNMAGAVTLVVDTDCSLQACLNTARANQCTNPYIILLPAGSNHSPANVLFDQESCDTKGFHPADVNLTTSAIHFVAHGLTELQPMQFGENYAAGSVWPTSVSCQDGAGQGLGFVNGQVFYAHPMGADDFRVYCPDKTTLMVFTAQGSTSNYFGFAGQPRTGLKWIVLRTSTPDSQLPPVGVRITPAWLPKMATLTDPIANFGQLGAANQWMVFGSTDGNNEWLVANIQIGPGIRLTTADAPEAHTSSDPGSWYQLVAVPRNDSNIIFRQTFWDLQPTPNRITIGFAWNGLNVGLFDSYLRNAVYFHSMNASTISRTNSTQFAVATGVVNGGGGNITVPNFSGTVAGGTTGVVYLFLDMANSNALTYTHPSGISVSCSGATCLDGGLGGTSNGSCKLWDSNVGSRDGWPVNGSGDPTAIPIGCLNLSSGAITTVQVGDPAASRYNQEGSNFMIGGQGPGPYMDINTYHECAGLCWHHDDSNPYGAFFVRGDYTYIHDSFITPFRYMYGHPLSDGLRYFQRQPLEWKSGNRIQLYGNRFDGSWAEVDAVSSFITVKSIAGQETSDVDIRNNTFAHGSGVIEGLTLVWGGALLTKPANRLRMQNNAAWDININGPQGGQYWVPAGGVGGADGFLTSGSVGTEDWIVDHNSVIGWHGAFPGLGFTYGANSEGIGFINNFLNLWSGTRGLQMEGGDVPINACTGLLGGALAACTFTPLSNLSSNVIQSGDSTQATVGTWGYPGSNIIPSDMDQSHNGYYNYSLALANAGNWRLKSTSPYIHAAADGLDIGANMNEIDAAQGRVQLGGVPANTITSSTATVAFLAPDAQGCPVDYSATDPTLITSFTRQADAGGARARAIALSGLPPNTTIYYRVDCSVEQPTGVFRTH